MNHPNRDHLVVGLQSVLAAEPFDLAHAALIIAGVEYPNLDADLYLEVLDGLGREAERRLGHVSGPSIRARIAVLNALVFEEERFAGNRGHYDDYRNSLLNVVLERRLGIPITLALVYIEVARRAGMVVQGIAFPGHFLMRVPARGADGEEDDVLLDPYEAGAEIDQTDCRRLLIRHVGDEAPFDPSLLRPCTRRQMLARMLNNLKRTYVEMRSFPQARRITDLMLAVDPTILSELRDRGLLAYHLDDFPAALRDLEDYLRLNSWKDEAEAEERDQVLDHIRGLRRRVAGLN